MPVTPQHATAPPPGGFFGQQAAQRVDVFIQDGARINHCNVALADDVGARAVKCKPAGIACGDSTNKRRQLLKPRVFKVVFIGERNAAGHIDSVIRAS